MERNARIPRVIARMVLMPDSDGESLTPAGGTAIAERPVDEILAQTPWVTIVWDDPVNLMSYVTHVFVTYFHYTKSKAEKLMLQVHTTGKAIVSSGTREAMERDVTAMHEYGLWATSTRRTSELAHKCAIYRRQAEHGSRHKARSAPSEPGERGNQT